MKITMKKNIASILTASLFALGTGIAGAQYYTNTTAAPIYTNNTVIHSNVLIPLPTNYAFITMSQFGMTSQEIANLQAYLASNPSVYPQGLVTGYFGPLTQAAVMRFQNLYGLSPVGYLDAATLAKLNLLISEGLLPVGGVGGASTIVFTSEMQVGSRGLEVSQLQTYLASDATLYPQGLVTGYFGPLTQAAVMRFQTRYGIPAVGRVGPLTLAKLNLLVNGGVSVGIDDSAPFISGLTVTASSNSATVSWNTNELTSGSVFYSLSPMVKIETVSPISAIPGAAVTASNMLSASQSVTLTGLTPNTSYYFLVQSVDQSGNASVSLENIFKTTF